jgi:hypothetical protein
MFALLLAAFFAISSLSPSLLEVSHQRLRPCSSARYRNPQLQNTMQSHISATHCLRKEARARNRNSWG